jgi:hypothetical protein
MIAAFAGQVVGWPTEATHIRTPILSKMAVSHKTFDNAVVSLSFSEIASSHLEWARVWEN